MKKHVLLATLASGLLFFNPSGQALADVDLHVNVGGPGFVVGYNPDFFYVPDLGYSISYGGPYDIIMYGGYYYLYRNGYWYRSRHYRHGRWVLIDRYRLPYKIRRYRWHDIRRFRDVHYRRVHPNRFRDRRERDWRDRRDDRRWDRDRRDDRRDRRYDRDEIRLR
ncbi:conserved hypothetical protein [Chlorobaculum parvum NCIB 8327]|uniref:Uncharacterized protein n=1 Tax=Chlorobaculum parvum (strain DSM 263 / NCIMB 8327) TaxID=517417 RepID=B3QP88_CHLP8|nr:YXWGXW repeat-containing protein [Chlorobaculum parvum]ACF11741.1 conserved hypothetical protein [Chlorobaculum parvum NCIB 8327]